MYCTDKYTIILIIILFNEKPIWINETDGGACYSSIEKWTGWIKK